MKKLTLALAFFLSANFLMAQESTNLVQTLNPQEAKGVKLDIQTTDGKNNPAAYEKSKDWDEGAGAIRLNIVIEANIPTAIIQQLVKAGRYKIQGNLKGDLFVIEAPNLQKTITIRGTDLVEKIKFKLTHTHRFIGCFDTGSFCHRNNFFHISTKECNTIV